jgi:hypothetical protein
VVKIATFAKPETVIAQCKKPTAQMAHLVFPDTKSQRSKNQKSHFFQRSTKNY